MEMSPEQYLQKCKEIGQYLIVARTYPGYLDAAPHPEDVEKKGKRRKLREFIGATLVELMYNLDSLFAPADQPRVEDEIIYLEYLFDKATERAARLRTQIFPN